MGPAGNQEKFWEGPYPEQQVGLDDKKMQILGEELKRKGYEFELTEDQSEYLLRVKGFEGIIHVTKVYDPKVDLYDIVRKRIEHPGS